MHPNEDLAAATGAQQWNVMGSQQSMMEAEGRHPGSRSPSPLPGADGDADMEAQHAQTSLKPGSEGGLDGLPRVYQFSSTMPEAPMGFGDIPDQPIFASQQPEPTKKTKKKRKDANRKAGLDTNTSVTDQQDLGNEEKEGLEDSARDVKNEPQSPDAQKKKKKKSRKSKSRTEEADESQQAPESSEEPPVLHTQLESQVLGNEPGHTRLQDVEAELQSPSERSTTRKKRRKSHEKANGKPLELRDDPIAGSDEDDIIPSSARASERRRSVHGSAADGARKFRQSEKMSTWNGDAIEDNAEPQLSGDMIASTQEHGPSGYVGSNALVGEESFLAGQDVSSPLLARKDRRQRSASRQASIAPRDGLSPGVKNDGTNSIPVADMDVDPNVYPGLNAMVIDSLQPSQQSQILGHNRDDDATGEDDDAMGEEVTQSTQVIASGDDGLAADMADDTMLTMAGMQEETVSNGAEDNIGTKKEATALHNEDQGQSTASSVSTTGSISKKAKQATSGKSRARKAVQRKSPEIDDTPEDVAFNAAPASTADGEAGQAGHVEDEAETQRRFNAEFNRDKDEDDQPSTPAHSAPSPVMASGRVTRSYKKRQPKPTFYEREEQQNAEAFAELPATEAADPPKTRARPKRRLQVAGEEEAAPRVKTQRRTKKAKLDADAEDDEEGNTTLGGSRYAQGPLTAEENAILDKIVQEFREEHGMTQYEVNELMKQNPREELPNELWNKLEEACTTRKRQKIINVCRQRFHNFVARGTWTAEQDDELMEQINRYGQKWSIIGKNINRHQKDVRDRWRNFLICRGKIVESSWSPEEESRFLDIVLEALRIFGEQRKAHPDIFGHKTNEQLVDWGIISERMGHSRTRLQCQEKWRRLRAAHRLDERFADQLPEWIPYGASWRHDKARKEIRQFTHDDKYKLVCAISEADVRSDAKIPWAKVEERMGLKGKVERVTLMIMWSRLRAAVPDQEDKNTTQCAEYLVEMYESEGGLPADIGNEGIDADMEERMISDHVAATEGKKGKSGSTGRRKSSQPKERKRSFPKSEALIQESDVEDDDEPAKDGDAEQANVDPALKSLGDGDDAADKSNAGDTDMRDADHVSVDLADNSELATLQHTAEEDMAIDPALDDIYDPVVAHEEEVPAVKPKRSRTSTMAETNGGQAPSSAKRSRKRKDVDVDDDDQGHANESPKASRKRMRIDNIIDPASPDKSRKRGRRTQKAMRPGEAFVASQGHPDMSSDIGEDMDDIPARMPIANLIN